MEIIIEGTKIELTADQVAKIEKELNKRKSAHNSFSLMLKHFGFISEGKGAYSHKNGWWAEIIDHGAWKSLWMTGKGLKDSGMFPGGWYYGTPKEVETELTRAVANWGLNDKF